MLMLLAMQTAAMPPAAMAVSAPPPMVRNYPVPVVTTIDPQAPLQVSDIDVVIRAPSGLLWQGTLRVAERGGESSWSQTRSEPPRSACPSRSSYFWNGEREMLSLSLASASREMAATLVVQVRWARRGEGACDGLRTVELRQTVEMTGRQTTTVSGDGGLRVELRRRPPA
jgi:hypothetical protein